MKILSRNFTTKEKILLAVLAVILVASLYYKFIYVYTSETIRSAKVEASTIESENTVLRARAEQADKMKAEVDSLMANGGTSRMESYNFSKMETAFLNQVLSDVGDYSISFANVTREGDQIRRNYSLSFRAPSYKAAEKVVESIAACEYRCLIGDLSCSVDRDGNTYVSMTATFFETMVGGVADSALPADTAETNN